MTNITAAPYDLVLTDKEGKKHSYRMSPLTDKDIVELDHYVQSEFIARARESCKDADDREARLTIEIALEKSAAVGFTTEYGARLMGTVDGLTRLVWQSLKTLQPHLTEDNLRELLFDPNNVREVNTVFRRMHHVDEKKKGAPSGNSKSRRKNVKRKSTKR